MLKYQKDNSWSLTYLLGIGKPSLFQKKSSTEVQVKLLAAGDSFTMAVTEVGGDRHCPMGKTPAT